MSDIRIKPAIKGLQDFLAEDVSLTDQISYEEFQAKKAAPNNSDNEIAEVYQTYRTAVEKL